MSCSRSALAGWARCTAPATPGSSATSRSRCSPSGSRRTSRHSRASSGKPGSSRRRLTNSGRIPHLLADGRALVYCNDGLLRFLDVASKRSVELLSIGWSSQVNNREFRVTRDGKQIVFVKAEHEADLWLMSPE